MESAIQFILLLLFLSQILLLFIELFDEEYLTLSPPGQHFIISDHKIQVSNACIIIV